MANPDSPLRLPTIAAAVALVAVVVGGVYLAGEWGASTTESLGPSAADSRGPTGAPARRPLPSEVTTLEATWTLATSAARGWREDARLTRLYATEVGRDGAIDRSLSSVQYVFLSPGATSVGPPVMNGYRWVLEGGAYGGDEIMQQPAPELTFPEPSLCSVATLLGNHAPERVTLDVRYAAPTAAKPTFQAFADGPEKWLLIADPSSCQVQMRSERMTDQEAAVAPSASAAGAGEGLFDTRAAEKAVDAALSRAPACGSSDGGVIATLTTTFANDGTVTAVDVEPAAVKSSSSYECIADRLRRIHVAPWQRGAGRVIRRLPF